MTEIQNRKQQNIGRTVLKELQRPPHRKRFAAAAAAILISASVLLLIFMDPGSLPAETIQPKKGGEKNRIRISEPSPGWWETKRHIYYGIPARIRFHLPDADMREARKIAEKAWAEFERIGKIFNPSDPDSEISRLNSADKTTPVKVSEEMFEVLKLSRLLWEKSDGAFDPTTTPVKKLWQDGVKKQQIPSKREIKNALTRTGFGNVELIPEKTTVVCKTDGIKFDFGGIAKGFSVDRAVALLKNSGINDGLVQLGGEIAAFGSSQDGDPRRIGIQHPTDIHKTWGTISAQGALRVSTSGNYRQPLRIRGHEFYHIFSPETGMPVSQKVLGVTTAHFSKKTSSAMIDGAATAITVMGSEKGMKLAQKLGIQALVLTRGHRGRIKQDSTFGLSDHYEQIDPQDP
ncbi:MAG: FAD:protein FMN transferase [Desulfobacteraceae bacterium]|nr:FAD:protein FMN transferase [Desulfobacteraceae bacterium]